MTSPNQPASLDENTASTAKPERTLKIVSKRKLFWQAFLAAVMLTIAAYFVTPLFERKINFQRYVESQVILSPVGGDVSITSQLRPGYIYELSRRHIRTLVDVRPDGEEQRQASSDEMRSAAENVGIDFYYIPVPHESIPDKAVMELSDVLSRGKTPTVLYCRTGKRAARLYALAEASRASGAGMDDILKLVRDAGFDAEDLKDDLARRIALRETTPTAK